MGRGLRQPGAAGALEGPTTRAHRRKRGVAEIGAVARATDLRRWRATGASNRTR